MMDGEEQYIEGDEYWVYNIIGLLIIIKKLNIIF